MNEYFDVDGNMVDIKDALYGKTKTSDGDYAYYVKAYKTQLFDPFNKMPADRMAKWQLKKVSQEVYELYVTFITTTSVKFKAFAERKL